MSEMNAINRKFERLLMACKNPIPETQYRVLTLWQPWASLYAHGIKKIETRPKPTTWTAEKGVYLIHAASKWTKEQADIGVTYPFADELLKLGYEFYNGKAMGLPLGQIIGAIEVTECQKIIYNNSDDFKTVYAKLQNGTIIEDPEESFGDYRAGRYAWLSQNPRLLKNPIPYKGGQGYYQKFNGDINQLEFI